MDDVSASNPAPKRVKKASAKAAEAAAIAKSVPMAPPDGTVSEQPLETPKLVEVPKEGPKQLPWTPEQEALLVDEVHKNKACERGDMGAKFEAISEALFNYPTFKAYKKVKGPTLQKKFNRLKEQCKRDWAMDGEGANLSGLASMDTDDFPQYKKVLYRMIVKEMKACNEKEAATAKDKQRNESMLTHEKVSLLLITPFSFLMFTCCRQC